MGLYESILKELGRKKGIFEKRVREAAIGAYERGVETCFCAIRRDGKIEITKISYEEEDSVAPEGRSYHLEGRGFDFDQFDEKIVLVHAHPGDEPGKADARDVILSLEDLLNLIPGRPEIVASCDGRYLHMIVVEREDCYLLSEELEEYALEVEYENLPKDDPEEFVKGLNAIEIDGERVFNAEYRRIKVEPEKAKNQKSRRKRNAS